MLKAVNWRDNVGRLFGGHLGRVMKVSLLFLGALTLLIGLYRVRTTRITKEEETSKNQLLKSAAAHAVPPIVLDKWVIVANPDDYSIHTEPEGFSPNSEQTVSGREYVCATASVAGSAGWKTIIIGPQLPCCSKPDCFSIEKSQFLRMPYRSAAIIRHLMGHGANHEPYKETIRNLAFIWAMHRGARYIYDAYVDEYQSAGVQIGVYEEEFSRQLHTLALDESLALVEERSKGRSSSFKNPYSHFGRPDVRLLPSGPGTSSGSKSHSHSHQAGHPTYTQYTTSPGTTGPIPSRYQDFPTYRICEVRPPSIEKFLEIDEGFWDFQAPSLVLPGDTMPPLCTRNTLFSPDVFWALPLLPDYSADDEDKLPQVPANASRIPPWYIRGLWSQSLLGDIGGSIRLTLARVPTLQLNKDYFVGGDYEPTVEGSNVDLTNTNRLARSSRLLKRWSCRSKSTFRCLLLMAKELSKSVHMGKDDLTLIEAWIVDLRTVRYPEPIMLPKRRSHTNPCLGADGLHGVSFHPALEPKYELRTEEYISQRNMTLRNIVSKILNPSEEAGPREKRETERPPALAMDLVPPQENSTQTPVDWSQHVSDYNPSEDNHDGPPRRRIRPGSRIPVDLVEDSYLPQRGHESLYNSDDVLLAERSVPLPNLDSHERQITNPSPSSARTGKHFRAFLQQIAAKSAQEGHAADEFPILKAMADNMCPGYGPLLPYQPTEVNSDILLIIVFTNHHYDLIPTLEVMYRSAYPNILYCGHPHESVEIFLRKYQSVEHRSFSFLPTYTRATYECVLGAIEMNYEVKGYMVINDETIMSSLNPSTLDREKVWVSTSGYDKVTRSTWERIDPVGQKLPRLLDGIASTWKLFTYLLGGQDGAPMDSTTPKSTIKKRSLEVTKEEAHGGSGESLEAEESAYIHGTNYRWDAKPENSTASAEGKSDLQVSDWDYRKPGSPATFVINSSVENDTNTSEDTTEEDIVLGDDEDDSSPTDTSMDMMGGLKLIEEELSASSPPSLLPDDPVTEDGLLVVTPSEDLLENTTSGSLWSSTPEPDTGLSSSILPIDPTESSIGVPLYHVEHNEPPTVPKWHKPDDAPGSSTERDVGFSSTGLPFERNSTASSGEVLEPWRGSSTEGGIPNSTAIPTSTDNGNNIPVDLVLKKEMETLLDILHETYKAMIAIAGEYQESHDDTSSLHTPEYSSEVTDSHLLEDSKSHRISPREFRHVRCSKIDDGQQSELCSTFRDYVNILGSNIGRDIRLFHDSIPMYFIPTSYIKTFYSVANVLLHYGVMDELALPIVFRGLAPEADWVHLNKTTEFSELENRNQSSTSSSHYMFPFSLHKVYSDPGVKRDFCSNYLLNVLQV